MSTADRLAQYREAIETWKAKRANAHKRKIPFTTPEPSSAQFAIGAEFADYTKQIREQVLK